MRIGTGPSGMDLTAQFSLLNALNNLDLNALRLSTMQRINSGADDPAGLIAAENLRAELTAIQAASDNAARARATVRVADSAMGEVGNLLNTIRGNVVAAAGGGLSDAELAALQLETDAALEAINRIGSTTSFGGRKLLDGSAGFQVSGVSSGQTDPITISGDGLTYLFSPDVADTSTLGLPTINTSALGGSAGRLSDLASGGQFSLTSNHIGKAIEVLDSATAVILQGRARAGAFEKYSIESSQRVLESMEVNISDALSQILDTDVAAETSRLVRSQVLVQAATSSLMLAGQSRRLIGGLFGSG